MASSPRASLGQARLILVWALLLLAAFQAIGGILVERCIPDARDPEYALKFRRLAGLRRSAPSHPIVLMLGSSRTLMGFRAGDVRFSHEGQEVTAFNFGLSGA